MLEVGGLAALVESPEIRTEGNTHVDTDSTLN